MDIIVVRLKAIKYKENSFCYLSSWAIIPSGRVPSSQYCSAPRLFHRFCSMGYATKFHQNLDAVCITKASDQDPSQQSSRVFSSLSPSLVASSDECPKATFLQPPSLIEESNRHQGTVLRCVQYAVHCSLVTEVSRAWCLWKAVTSSIQAPS